VYVFSHLARPTNDDSRANHTAVHSGDYSIVLRLLIWKSRLSVTQILRQRARALGTIDINSELELAQAQQVVAAEDVSSGSAEELALRRSADQAKYDYIRSVFLSMEGRLDPRHWEVLLLWLNLPRPSNRQLAQALGVEHHTAGKYLRDALEVVRVELLSRQMTHVTSGRCHECRSQFTDSELAVLSVLTRVGVRAWTIDGLAEAYARAGWGRLVESDSIEFVPPPPLPEEAVIEIERVRRTEATAVRRYLHQESPPTLSDEDNDLWTEYALALCAQRAANTAAAGFRVYVNRITTRIAERQFHQIRETAGEALRKLGRQVQMLEDSE
jgi:hypothetical protein